MFNFSYFKKTVITDGEETKKESKTKSSFFDEIDKAVDNIDKAVGEMGDIINKVFEDINTSGETIECDNISVTVKDGKVEIKGKDIQEVTLNGTKLYGK